MHAPHLHPGGTDKVTLINMLIDAREAFYNARKALEATAPNSRDYLSPDSQFIYAVSDHLNRIGKIVEVDNELQRLMEAIDASDWRE